MITKHTTLLSASALALILGLASTQSLGYSISVSPNSGDYVAVFPYSGTGNLSGADVADLVGYDDSTDPLVEAYKQNYGGSESGSFDAFYTTVFVMTPDGNQTEPTGATITWTGSGTNFIDCPECFLVVKDGNLGNPAQYLFDIGNWNGTDTINLSGFWDGEGVQGSISNIAIWTGPAEPEDPEDPTGETPEPGVLFLMGAGLLGLGMARRRKSA